ncbi:MAG: riboflavin synthase [Alphaproteobacteria bacterium]|nr:MAG: riboflavin synthase [Alphaproteobacteria bacterium]
MFTGIISDIGTVRSIRQLAAGIRLRVGTQYDPDSIALGASIACAGACLTIIDAGRDGEGGYFDVEASSETLARTTLGQWKAGTALNLERALRAGDELGGHILTGHVDGVATIVARVEDGDMARFDLEAPPALSRYIAEKGSIALDGVSLTVNGVEGSRFWVMLIPHSLGATTWGNRQAGDCVNLEVDLFARYLDRLSQSD